jgi:hypothetical protein
LFFLGNLRTFEGEGGRWYGQSGQPHPDSPVEKSAAHLATSPGWMQPKILIPPFTTSVIKKIRKHCIVLSIVDFVLTVLLKLRYELLLLKWWESRPVSHVWVMPWPLRICIYRNIQIAGIYFFIYIFNKMR